MRGAVSVALVYLYYDPDGTTVDQMKSSLISMTLTVVLFSTIVYGAITKPMLDFLLGAQGASISLPSTPGSQLQSYTGHLLSQSRGLAVYDLTTTPTAAQHECVHISCKFSCGAGMGMAACDSSSHRWGHQGRVSV